MNSFTLLAIFLQIIIVNGSYYGKFPAAAHYWPMQRTNGRILTDVEAEKLDADLHGVSFINASRLGDAVSFSGPWQWIDVDIGITRDCLAFRFSSCNDNPEISLHFWLRVRHAKRILATASYTNSTKGPGILIEYDETNKTLNVDFANSERHWSTKINFPKYSWCHVTASWSIDNGLLVVLDGNPDDPNFKAVDTRGKSELTNAKPYRKMITIGLDDFEREKDPNNGHFDMSHLVIYYRKVNELEIKKFPEISLSKPTFDVSNKCKAKQNEPCYKDPCLMIDCNIEKKYTDTICVNVGFALKHPKCDKELNGTFTTLVPVTNTMSGTDNQNNRVNTEVKTNSIESTDREEVNCNEFVHNKLLGYKGCGNNLQTGEPFCKEKKCFYGRCISKGRSTGCECPLCDNVAGPPVCGDNKQRYENICVMKSRSCVRETIIKEVPCDDVLRNATHYWPLDESTGELVRDLNGKTKTTLFNNITRKHYKQLGLDYVLDIKEEGWIDIKGLQDPCISSLTCSQGISVGFWINYKGGDYIIAAGGYAEQDKGQATPLGFRLKRDEEESSLFQLMIATASSKWILSFKEFEKEWVYVTFTWNQNDGLKLYLNGNMMYHTKMRHILDTNLKPKQSLSRYNDIMLAKKDVFSTAGNSGKFEIAQLAIWKKTLSSNDILKVHGGTVKRNIEVDMCCYRLEYARDGLSCNELIQESKKCICPELNMDNVLSKCKKTEPASLRGCENLHKTCDTMNFEQINFCSSPLAKNCIKTCNLCVLRPLASSQPQNHFSRETLIFSILGCVGGLTLLLGVTFYFWKFYRTRFHGAFVPPVKTSVSLLDVSDTYDDEKWPTKYIDNSTYYIKDVPPKKRALPLIPARHTQVHHGVRYQPPAFD